LRVTIAKEIDEFSLLSTDPFLAARLTGGLARLSV
jgi:hypothetical protein